MKQLELLGAVEKKEEQVLLTSLGKKMASFPLEPRFSKVPLCTSAQNCFSYDGVTKVEVK